MISCSETGLEASHTPKTFSSAVVYSAFLPVCSSICPYTRPLTRWLTLPSTFLCFLRLPLPNSPHQPPPPPFFCCCFFKLWLHSSCPNDPRPSVSSHCTRALTLTCLCSDLDPFRRTTLSAFLGSGHLVLRLPRFLLSSSFHSPTYISPPSLLHFDDFQLSHIHRGHNSVTSASALVINSSLSTPNPSLRCPFPLCVIRAVNHGLAV